MRPSNTYTVELFIYHPPQSFINFFFKPGVKAGDGVIVYLLSQRQPVSKMACVNKYDVMTALVTQTAGKSFSQGLKKDDYFSFCLLPGTEQLAPLLLGR